MAAVGPEHEVASLVALVVGEGGFLVQWEGLLFHNLILYLGHCCMEVEGRGLEVSY